MIGRDIMFTPAESGSGKTHFVKSMIRKMIPGNTLFFYVYSGPHGIVIYNRLFFY